MKATLRLSVVAVCLGLLALSAAAQNSYKVSAPYTYKNLSVFLIEGKDESKTDNVLTLQEAMQRGVFRVYETSDVNELEVENVSKTFDVFVQSGDIVKGGKQDRILGVSIIIPARSGRISIEAFCVESGRWEKRGAEDSRQFNSSNDRIVTKELKLAANSARSQSDVWAQVSEAQSRLSKNVGGLVNSAESSSSLQLALENSKVVANVNDYVKALGGIVNGRSNVIGYAVAINGKVNSADVYVSNALFKKLWAKMLKASATEAVAESRGVRLAAPVKTEAIKTFLDDADSAKGKDEKMSAGATLTTREDRDNVVFEAKDSKAGKIVHKSYVRKN
ncbi:MAG TPA: DUF6569 family protein [Pyrinomonadaceae bacterium]|jgi:hypothetical protein|nr:DUF6569 family protein [Pyrinomonadaceae bacterium]